MLVRDKRDKDHTTRAKRLRRRPTGIANRFGVSPPATMALLGKIFAELTTHGEMKGTAS
jgi:hypothetical protein